MNQDIAIYNPRMFFWAILCGAINFMLPVTTLFFYHRGLDAQGIFYMLITWVVTAFLAEIPTGTLGDWIGYKRAFLLGFVLNTASLVIWYFADTPALFYLSAVASAIGICFFSGSEEAFIYESLKTAKREAEMSRIWAGISAARWLPALIAVPLGAWLARDLDESGFRIILILTIVTNLLQGLFLLLLKPLPTQTETPSAGHLLSMSFGDLRRNRDLLLIASHECMVMVPTLILTASYSLTQPYLVDAGLPVPALGWVYAADALLCFLLLRSVGRVESSLGRLPALYLSGAAILIAFVVGYFLRGNPAIAIAVYIAIKLCWVFRFPLFSQLKNDHIQSQNRATTLSILSMVDSLFDLLILGSLSALADYPVPQLFGFCAIVVLLGMLIPLRPAKTTPA